MSKLKNKRASKVTAILLALMMAVVFMPTFAFAADGDGDAAGITVYMTVSDEGVLAKAKDGSAMVWQPVAVTDADNDGTITYHEALIAAHEQYFEGGAAGYEADFSYGSAWVTKMWGKSAAAGSSFMTNDVACSSTVDVTAVKDGDYLLASNNLDATNYADWNAYFDKKEAAAKVGETFTLQLEGYQAMTVNAPKPAADVTVGTWEDGNFVPMKDAGGAEIKTDANGAVDISFDKAGTYIVTAKGTVKDSVLPWGAEEPFEADCPIIAPACIVKVAAADIEVAMTVSDEGVLAKAKDGSAMAWQPVTVSDADCDGTITYHEALIAAHEQYFEGGAAGYEADFSYGSAWVTKMWGKSAAAGSSFMTNDVACSSTVDVTAVKDGDYLLASNNQDATNYADWNTYFDQKQIKAFVGDEITVKLEGYQAMTVNPPAPAVGVNIGIWEDGTFIPLGDDQGADLKTDAEGKATVSFFEAGTFILTANGAVKDSVLPWGAETAFEADCPVIAPCCIITVAKKANPMKATGKNVNAKAKKKTVISAKKAFKITDKKGKITYKQVTKNKKITVSKSGKITVKKGLKKGKTYRIKVNVTDSGNREFAKVTKTATVKIKIK